MTGASSTGAAVTEVLTPWLQLVRAPNPGPMTLEGTNTWVVGDAEQAAPVVVDPGPLLAAHLDAVWDACRGRVAAVVLTHRHADHSAAAAALAERAGCSVWAAEPSLSTREPALFGGDVLGAAQVELVAVATPGHTSDSYSFLLQGPTGEPPRLLTGDTVLGRGTTVVTHPDGSLGDYLASLGRLVTLVQRHGVQEFLPGHGPRVADPQDRLAAYGRHRLERLEQVRSALAAGDRTPAEIVARVYRDVDRAVWPAAEQSVSAQLEYLSGQG